MSSNNVLLEWSSFPLVERPVVSVILIAFIIMLGIILWNITVIHWEMPLFYYLGMFLVILNLSPYFIRTKYILFDDRIQIHYGFIKIIRKYEDFSCFYCDKRGVLLGTFRRPSRLDRFRGQSLRFSVLKSEKEALVRILSDKIGKQY